MLTLKVIRRTFLNRQKEVHAKPWETLYSKALLVMAIAWAKGLNLLDQNVKWHQQKQNRGRGLDNSQAKLVWNFEFSLQKNKTKNKKKRDLGGQI